MVLGSLFYRIVLYVVYSVHVFSITDKGEVFHLGLEPVSVMNDFSVNCSVISFDEHLLITAVFRKIKFRVLKISCVKSSDGQDYMIFRSKRF